MTTSPSRPRVLFMCVHNAGRSQMAAGFLHALAGDRIDVVSAGSQPGQSVNPAAVRVMGEVGIDISGGSPQLATADMMQAADVVVTMGCGDTCVYYPAKRYLDWDLEDPAGKDVATVRRIRDEIRDHVRTLASELVDAPEVADTRSE